MVKRPKFLGLVLSATLIVAPNAAFADRQGLAKTAGALSAAGSALSFGQGVIYMSEAVVLFNANKIPEGSIKMLMAAGEFAQGGADVLNGVDNMISADKAKGEGGGGEAGPKIGYTDASKLPDSVQQYLASKNVNPNEFVNQLTSGQLRSPNDVARALGERESSEAELARAEANIASSLSDPGVLTNVPDVALVAEAAPPPALPVLSDESVGYKKDDGKAEDSAPRPGGFSSPGPNKSASSDLGNSLNGLLQKLDEFVGPGKRPRTAKGETHGAGGGKNDSEESSGSYRGLFERPDHGGLLSKLLGGDGEAQSQAEANLLAQGVMLPQRTKAGVTLNVFQIGRWHYLTAKKARRVGRDVRMTASLNNTDY